jgi:3'-phosphoadenosine 5'-phosphosulfate sulfotransferase (PAPS reductase)/FAD synthetase
MRTLLQLSGGKDSMALLYFMEAFWNFIDIAWLDTGDCPPSTERRIIDTVGHLRGFHRIKTDSKGFRRENGEPRSDNWLACCSLNMYLPMADFVREGGYRQVLRGTKACDPHVHGVYPGDVVEGVLYTFPLWNWTDDDVEEYLGDRLPVQYRNGAIGMPDCVTCPAVEPCGNTTKHLWKE